MSGKRQKQNAHEAHKLQNTWAVADLREDVEKDLVKHELSQMHFRARQFSLFTIPQAILTLLSSVLAFLSTAFFFGEESHASAIMSSIVGIFSGLVVFLQTLSGNCKYDERATMHDTMATSLRGLKKHLLILERKLQLMRPPKITTISESKGSDPEPNTFEWIADQQRQFLAGCKSRCPLPITDAFDALDSKLEIRWAAFIKDFEELNKEEEDETDEDKKTKIGEKIAKKKEKVKHHAVKILSTEIQDFQRFPILLRFPLLLPNSKTMVDKTLELLEEEMDVDREENAHEKIILKQGMNDEEEIVFEAA